MRLHEEWWTTPQRIAVHEPSRTAVLADLHLGYAEARRRRGEAVPWADLAESLAPLAETCREWDCPRFVVAGDLFERACTEELLTDLESWQRTQGLEMAALVPGNHDRGLAPFAGRLPLFPEGYPLGDWLVVHGDRPLPNRGIVLGHWHPSVFHRGRKRPCYLAAPSCLVLPAFSEDAAGANLRNDPRFFGWRCLPIVGNELVDGGRLSPPVSRRVPSPNGNSRPWRGRLRPG